MRYLSRRLRDADPARELPPQPDDRAERDLRTLLAEAPVAGRGEVDAPPRRRITVPVLATVVVATLVVALTATVLAAVRPRADVGGGLPTASTGSASGCRPAEVLPFACGTYRSVYGDGSVTGSSGGPAEDRLSISFTRQDGRLVLSALADGCFAATVPVDFVVDERTPSAGRLTPRDQPRYDRGACRGPQPDPGRWAEEWLQRPHEVQAGGGLTFDLRTAMVTFDYQGTAELGEAQWPRNDRDCVPAHVAPFACGAYRLTRGIAPLEVGRPFQLSFAHINGTLTASLGGGCNSTSSELQIDGSTLVTTGVGSTLAGCDDALNAPIKGLFAKQTTFRVDGDTVTFASGSSTWVFVRNPDGCLVQGSARWCGESTPARGTGALAGLGRNEVRLTLSAKRSVLVATVHAPCRVLVLDLVDRAASAYVRQRTTTSAPCARAARAEDRAVSALFDGDFAYRIDGDTITFSKNGASATFQRP